MPTRNVNLTDHQDAFVGSALASGRYQNASEVVREALRLLENRELDDIEKRARLRNAVNEAEAAIASGDFVELGHEDISRWLSGLGVADAA
ncbi:MAG: type II toxin-antitoxin system ParD family antitoxin [Sandarakinorhabdus sp.]|nr:type II toxin-antitoxin system ParD family antitoxin [Sandarakinorhabdus sp.]